MPVIRSGSIERARKTSLPVNEEAATRTRVSKPKTEPLPFQIKSAQNGCKQNSRKQTAENTNQLTVLEEASNTMGGRIRPVIETELRPQSVTAQP